MVWEEAASLTQRFRYAYKTLVAWFPKSRRPGKSLSGFLAASLRHSPVLLALVEERLWQLIQEVASRGNCWLVRGWVPLGADGTREPAPRTKANRRGLGGLGRDRHNPQGWLTNLIHLGTGVPWCFTVGRGDSSERLHLRHMLGNLPRQTLLIADAGYVGYDLWKLMLELGQPFLFRVGGNINLLRRLSGQIRLDSQRGLVWLWPEGKRAQQPPLMLRLMTFHDGKRPMYLVTNVLQKSHLSQQDALVFYRLRWGMELWFRSMKQTMGKAKLRSRAPEQALLELSWTAVGLTVLGLMHVEGLIDQGQDPQRASVAGALAVVRQALRTPGAKQRTCRRLLLRLGQTWKDTYVRRRPKHQGRYPRKKKYRRISPPHVRLATKQEQQYYRRFMCANHPLALSA